MALLETVRLTVICFTLSLSCSFQFGFSTTYMNTAVDGFKDYLNTSLSKRHLKMTDGTYSWIWDLIANAWSVGFFFGIWLSPMINDKFGRKIGFISMNAVSLLASILRLVAIIAYLPELLFLGQLVASISTAVTYQSLILYLQECSPTALRGVMSFTSEISYASMALLGMFLGLDSIFGKNLRFLVGFAVIPSLIALIVLFPMPETPKYLYIVKKDPKAASKSIHFYHGKSADISSVLHEIALEAEQDSQSNSSIKEILTTPYLRKAVLLSCLALQNTVALWAILLSSTKFLKDANLKEDIAEWSSTGMALAYVIGTILGSTCIEKYGRRPMILIFSTANTVSLLLYVIFAALQPSMSFLQYGCLLCFLSYGFTYGFGIGPVVSFISSELVSQKHRSLVQSLCLGINFTAVIISTFTILSLFSVIKAYAFLILYIIPCSLSILILFAQLPETKGREIHEIVAELRGKTTLKVNGLENEN